MPHTPVPNYHRFIMALDDAIFALDEVLDETAAARTLPNRIRGRLMAMVEEMREIQASLEDAPDDITRERNDDVLMETMDEIADETS